MRIITMKRLWSLVEHHPDCRSAITRWGQLAEQARWQHLAQVRLTFPHADTVEGKTVFNIKGNDYRLMTEINYETQTIYIRDLLTHADYDRGRWK